MPYPQTKPKQADVARSAGVSQAMVSYVLNANSNLTIPTETRQRILDAIEQLGYIPNRSARSLRTHKTSTLAVILPDITNPYHPIFARGAQDAAEQHGYDLTIYNTDGLYAREKSVLEAVLQNNVDGLIGAFLHLKVEELQRLYQRGVAVVLTEWYPHELSAWPAQFVCIDNVQAAADVVNFLIHSGRRRIAHIRGIPGAPPAEARLAGYRQTLLQCGLPLEDRLVQPGEFSIPGGFQAAQALLSLPEPPDAIFAANDLSAIGAIQALQRAGRSVPADVAVVGFDDIPAATIVNPALTTIRPFQKLIGVRAAELLIETIRTGPPDRETRLDLPFELVLRDSA